MENLGFLKERIMYLYALFQANLTELFQTHGG